MDHVTSPRPFRDGLSSVVDLCTKFENPTFTHYKDMKDNENVIMWVFGGLCVTQVIGNIDRAHTTSYLTFVETARLSYTVFEYSELFV